MTAQYLLNPQTMTREEAAQYKKDVDSLLKCIEKYERKLFNLKQRSFTKNSMVTNFYKAAEIDLKDCQQHIKNAYHLHSSYINEKLER